jgi:DNA-binding CsgD family transcriptional regulator/tetratricopeptide (TPR) repeat protein
LVQSHALIGRHDELEFLEAALLAGRAGRGSVVVVSGEAGIGKSRLAREAADRAALSGMPVLRGRAVQAAGHVPFRAFAEALRSIHRDRAATFVREIEPYGRALAHVVPEWSGPTGSETSAGVVPEAVVRLLSALGRDSGVLVVLEDLHLADPDSLAVLEYLADNVAEQPVVVIGTERSDWPGAAASVLAELVSRRSVARVALLPLSEDSVEEMARAALGVESVPAGVVGALRRRAEGVPFLVEEMLSAYAASGGPAGGAEWWIARRIADSLPPSYRDLVGERLDRLDADARRVVAAAAMVGRTFDWRLLGPIGGLGNDEVLAALRSAAREQLVAGADGQGVESFSFRHALARETVLADLLPPELAALAAHAADVIEDAYPGLPGDWCERAAELRIQAGDRLGASRLLQESGRRALARGALATAEAALHRAHEMVADDPMAWLGVDELLLEVLSLAGKTDRLVELGQRVLAGLDRYLSLSPDSLLRARAAGLHLRLARAALLERELKLAREHVEKARERTGSGTSDDAGAVRMDATDAHLTLAEGDPSTAAMLADAAGTSADRLGLPDVLCDALDAAGRAALQSGNLQAAADAFGRMEEASRAANLLVQATVALVELGKLDRLTGADDRRLQQARRLAVSTGAVSTLVGIDLELALYHLGVANLDAATACLGSALETSRAYRLGLRSHVLAAQGLLHALAGPRGQMEQALAAALEEAPADPAVMGAVHGARAVDRLARGERDRALGELDAAIRVSADSQALDAWLLPELRTLLLTVLTKTDEAPIASGARSVESPYPASRAYLAYAEAVAFGRSGRIDDAAAAFALGDALMPPGWVRHYARVLVGEAAARDGWGEPGAWASEALTFFERVGLRGLGNQARAVMRSAGTPVPRRGRGTAEVPAALRSLGVTSREVEVLELVGLGLSNDEVGARLFLSPRTVETHVTSLLRKTRTETRPQLVAFTAHHMESPR